MRCSKFNVYEDLLDCPYYIIIEKHERTHDHLQVEEKTFCSKHDEKVYHNCKQLKKTDCFEV